jgi:CelD/BcsL family acetyltransferase involved in cellulose biosynthesis
MRFVSTTRESLDDLNPLRLPWPSPFTQPGWMRAWHEVLAPRTDLWVRAFWEGGKPIGLAPLRLENGTARLIGDPDVCDHLDLVAAAGREEPFCHALLEALQAERVTRLDLTPLRPDSTVLQALVPAARAAGHPVDLREEGVLFAMDLPASWEEYLQRLSGKQRHEVRRKQRRLEAHGAVDFRMTVQPAALPSALDQFLALFRRNRADKAAFMDARMEAFFRRLTEWVPGMCIGILSITGIPVSGTLCCDHFGIRYLYNSAYDAGVSHLSVGLAAKLASIREGIERGLSSYDFLKGEEPYKQQLGGRPVPLVHCRIDLLQAG